MAYIQVHSKSQGWVQARKVGGLVIGSVHLGAHQPLYFPPFFCEWLMLHAGSCKYHMPGGNSVAYIQKYYKGPYPLD